MHAKFPMGPLVPVDPHSKNALPAAPAIKVSAAFRAALGKAGADGHPDGGERKPARAAREARAGEDKALKGGKAPPKRLAPRQGHR